MIVTNLFRGYFDFSPNCIDDLQQKYAQCVRSQTRPYFRSEPFPLPHKSTVECHAIYQSAVKDHVEVQKRQVLQPALEHCFPSFTNLDSIGLWNVECSVPRLGQRYRGIKKLREQLRFDPLNVVDTGWNHSRFTGTILASLLAAIATTKAKIKEISTCGANEITLMDGRGLHLTPAEKTSLIPILKELQHMNWTCVSSERQLLGEGDAKISQDEANSKEFLLTLAEAAPSLKSLTVFTFEGQPNHDRETLVDKQFLWISQRFHFSRLSALELASIVTTVSAFTTLLRSALPTLTDLRFARIFLRDNRNFPSPKERNDECVREGMKIWREVCTILQDQGSLQTLKFECLGYQNKFIGIRDPNHGPYGTNPLCITDNFACYTRKRAHISFHEWIENLKFTDRYPLPHD
ncbi:hypothetical protein BO78DRAFT_419988 [Aspergillus sclerotiicarbonarius CBS 121057]|uniref:Uncharacterized protein n=1 Tax=Aspergillus sclerotiicarbonarius (strain CBS 121057 / IBT 28362) TaxID=1448318 RepID=A0A319E565_ASPSB|nr:hypothetical protein BO78DRAFT_419988 [Aspergillus sclerotiicarbonarius CBS 121057]